MSLNFRLINLILALFALLAGGLWLQNHRERKNLVVLHEQIEASFKDLARSPSRR
jgi:hypothetical protein